MRFWQFLRDLVSSEEDCPDCGPLQQIDAILSDGLPLRVMKSRDGFHVSVWPHSPEPPPAVSKERVESEVLRQWLDG